ncbi:MAG: lysoplasmalogenase [Candidatus Neomarinimicrobiota bacterium]|nr:MAG: lysoplasmalogenase [Candidatus Neomarinimicrobiota bacterium]
MVVFLIGIGALITILADLKGDFRLLLIYKPLTTVLILLLAWMGGPVTDRYRNLLCLGLICSLAGDIFLLWKDRFFLPGLVSFLLAHILYSLAFLTGRKVRVRGTVIPYLIYGGVIYGLLFPGLGGLRWPVLGYVLVILFMAWQALERKRWRPEVGSWAALGALLFVVSDSCLAWNRFRSPLPVAPLLVLGTYYLAQTLLALSVRREANLSRETAG